MEYCSNFYCNNCNGSLINISVVNLVRPSLPFVTTTLAVPQGIVR